MCFKLNSAKLAIGINTIEPFLSPSFKLPIDVLGFSISGMYLVKLIFTSNFKKWKLTSPRKPNEVVVVAHMLFVK
jgi:ABC-type enterobactin transport system permease subunit